MATDTNSPLTPGALSGVRILDLTRILAGPTCTQLMGDLGADVIKIERAGVGDDTRTWGPPYVKDAGGADTSESAYYLCANRNKRSVAVDISKTEGADLVRRLAAQCDILIENFKVGGLAAYGLGYDDLKESHPQLVYCSITGFGQYGPHAEQAGYDILAQGQGGMMSITGDPDGEPMKVGVGIADVMCGMYAGVAILGALRHRDLTGQGQYIDISLLDSQIAWLINEGTNYLTSGQPPTRRGNQHPNIVPYQVFEASDGHVIVAVGNDRQFERFCDMLAVPDLAADARFVRNADRLAHRDELVALLEVEVRKFSKADVLEGLKQRGVPVGPVDTVPEVFASEQVAVRDMKISMPHPSAGSGAVDLIGNPLKMGATPVSYRRPPPTLGQHTDEVLAELLELDDGALADLRRGKVI